MRQNKEYSQIKPDIANIEEITRGSVLQPRLRRQYDPVVIFNCKAAVSSPMAKKEGSKMLEIRMEDIAEQDEVRSTCGKDVVVFVCPVYGIPVSDPHLLDVQGAIADGLYFAQKSCNVDSEVGFGHGVHYYDEEGSGMEELHVTVIRPEFASTDACTRFDILEIRLTGDNMRFCAERNRGSGR